MKTSKKIISLVLSVVMFLTMFAGVDITSLFDIEASAADEITLGGITQQRVVSNYEAIYAEYQNRFFTGKASNSPTNFVIPGLASKDDYTPQGMTYWEEKEWILISAYDASGSGKHSVIYAIDASSTKFVALFKILNADGSINTSHGGGIAASKYNFYYADTASKISYIPLSEFDVAEGTVKEVKLKGSIDCKGELGDAATSYCCYEDGVLWAGNFYYTGDSRYSESAHDASDSMIVGYALHGESSDEEWHYLSTGYNYVTSLNSTTEQTSGAMKYTTSIVGGSKIMITGNITTTTAIGECTANFASFSLVEGKKYTIEFTSTNNLTDMYMFSPVGTHCNVKQSQQTKITQLPDGRYRYSMTFTAGLKPTGADSSWPTTQSTDGSYTGTYTVRFDQDNITGDRAFVIKDFAVMDYVSDGFESDKAYEGLGCAGNPTYVIGIAGIDKIQYAMVFKGKIYISRSWKRTSGDNHTRELMVGDIDINSPGATNLVINGRNRPCHILNLDSMTRFGGDNGASNINQMFYMGEALCVMDDYLYMFGEGAAWNYNGKDGGNVCPEPIDVIWKIDQYAIMEESRIYDDTKAAYYEKVDSLSEINMTDDYLIVHTSSVKHPVTQKNIIYAIDSFGGYGAKKLPKQDAGTQANTGDSLGIVGYEISTYSTGISENGKEIIYVPEDVDAQNSIHWTITGAGTSSVRINNNDLYYTKNNHLYFGSRLFAMTTDARTNLDRITLEQYGDTGSGNFRLYYAGDSNYYLWCNDGSNADYIATYTDYYSNHGKTGYVPNYHGLEETVGTFHSDAELLHTSTGNLTGAGVPVDMQLIQIYKRVADPYSSVQDTRVYTDMHSDLQSDGTYTVTLETYAISPQQYQTVDERPTDFIFVLDASGSMTNNTDCVGYHNEKSNWDPLTMAQACGDVSDDFFKRGSNYNTAHASNFYYKFPDSEYGRIYVAFNEKDSSSTYARDIWLWCEHPITGRCYKISKNGYLLVNTPTGDCDNETTSDRLTEAMFLANPAGYGYASNSEIISETQSDINRTDYHGTSYNHTYERADYEVLYATYTDGYGDTRGTYYSYGNCYRLEGMQQAVEELTYKIADEAAKTGLNHRIAVTQFGSNGSESWLNTGMYTNSSVSMVQYTGEGTIASSQYQSAFYDVANFSSVRRIINNIITTNGDPDTYSNYGFDMAQNIVTNASAVGTNYLGDGNRSACIIMITDGIPGIGNDSTVANDVANAAINNAYNAKKNGAYVYSVQMGNNTLDGFEMSAYMDYVSSEFMFAESMTNPGDRNVKDVEYHIDVPTGSTFNLDNLVNEMFESVTSNSTNAMAELDAESILRAHISDTFLTTNASVEIQTAKAFYDGLGRVAFEDPVTITDGSISAAVVPDTDVHAIDVTGFDYSTYFVSDNNENGKKLIVKIKGLLADPTRSIINTDITVPEATALYADQKMFDKGMEIKQYPTENFTIPEYTYVLDYGIPMLDVDVNGTIVSVDEFPRKQNSYNSYYNTGDVGIGITPDKQNLLYTVNPEGDGTSSDLMDISKGYVLIQRPDDTYDWFRLNILPASNVYFEESTIGINNRTDCVDWSAAGSAINQYQTLTGANDIYGYDSAYDVAGNSFSNGTYWQSTVTESNTRSDTASFVYTGTGFDLVSACGKNTGIMIVTVKNSSGGVEKAYIIDTYYTDTTYVNDDGLLCQVPIIQHKGAHGTYSVEVTSVYLASAVSGRTAYSLRSDGEDVDFYTADLSDEAVEAVLCFAEMEELMGEDIEVIFADENSIFNGGTGAASSSVSTFALGSATTGVTSLVNYLDGFRIYNPLNNMGGYYPDSEKEVTYYNVINDVANNNLGQNENLAGIVYLAGDSVDTLTFTQYQSSGPKNEVYLTPGGTEGLAFEFAYQQGATLSLGMRSVDGKPVTVKVNDKEITVTSTTEMYYDISDIVYNEYGGAYGWPVVTIQNTGGGLLAVNNLKFCAGTIAPASYSMLPRMRMMMAMPVAEEDSSASDSDSKYPDYVPDEKVENPDPDLDVEGSIPDYVSPEDTGNDTAISFSEILTSIKSFFEKLIEIVTKIFSFFAEV